ncbi:MAG: ABC transporter ATP-binding protein/permease, partial [Chlamydiales bacterium]|nr:ABC transporter ATP-binding protein/permease [Chlamydiales bacterium]
MKKKHMPPTLLAFLLHFAGKYWFYLSGIVLVGIFWAANVSLTPYTIKLIVDAVTDAAPGDDLFAITLVPVAIYIALSMGVNIVYRWYDWLCLKTFPDMEMRIKKKIFSHIESHSFSFFQQNLTGSLANKINDLSKGTGKIILETIDYFFARGMGLLIGMYTMYTVHPSFAGILGLWSVIFFAASIYLSQKAKKYAEDFSEARSTAVGKIVDSLGNIFNIKLFARERYEKRYLRGYLDEASEINQRSEWYLLKVKAFYSLSITLLTIGMLWLLLYERSLGAITVGDFALILTLNMFLIEELFFISGQLVDFTEELGTCSQALAAVSTGHEIVDAPGASVLVVNRGEIAFENVNFTYKKGRPLFANKSITIKPGEKVGLVGFSGSGKSTFVNLILRFFDVDEGSICIDGQDISKVTQESLRSQIAVIPQDPILFNRSILENIRYGRIDATDEEVIACSKIAHCHEFIEKMPQGYNSQVGERGVKISGGQKQRIAIARAILKNAPILILDEATSALDSVTEGHIQESLNHSMKDRTTLVVAHRLSTLCHMDRILVFHHGKIVEDGSHSQLLALNGQYAKLWNMQAGSNPKDEKRYATPKP